MNSIEKEWCPFMELCWQKNPIHFGELSHPHLEKLLVDQLDGAIEIPEVLHFTCNNRLELLDQLKVLQMVLRKEREREMVLRKERRERNKDSQLSVTSSSSSKTQSSAVISSSKDDLKEKVERYEEATVQKRQDKLKQMDAEAQAFSEALADEENLERSEIKATKRCQESSETSSSVTNKMREMSIESVRYTMDNQRNVNDSQSSSKNNEQNANPGTSIMDMYEACDSEKSREEVRQRAIQMMRKSGCTVSVVEPGEFATKYASAAPYHLFYSRIENSEETYSQQYSITFPEILDRSLGEIVKSLHLNFMVDVEWLCLQYLLAGQPNDMVIFYGERIDHEKLSSNITMIEVDMPTRSGCHHTKMTILQYKDDGIRVVVSTANLYSDDWDNRTQGLWISPHLPLLPNSVDPDVGESSTGFRADLERYLSKYRHPALTQWIRALRRRDFSDVNVFLVASVPGIYRYRKADFWGHRKLAYVLLRYAVLPPDAPQWPIVAQSSSIGSLGRKAEGWLSREIISSMSLDEELHFDYGNPPHFQLIYPSIQNYEQSFDRQNLSCCLSYSAEVNSKQHWIESYLYEWKAKRTGRDRVMPHINSYTRISPDLKRIPWFVLTSADLSKAAWGVQRNHQNYCIMNYEVGVLFLPVFLTRTSYTFPIEEEEDPAVPVFPIPYDVPLCRYKSNDSPFNGECLNLLGKM